MTEALFSNIDESCEALKLDFSSAEFAAFCEENAFSPETIRGIELLLGYLRKKKVEMSINTLLRLSRLPPIAVEGPKDFRQL